MGATSNRGFPEDLPVIPRAKGFGILTVAGSGRHLSPPVTAVLRVTNLNASGPGSLREALAKSGPRVIVFEISGTINISEDLLVDEPYLTIAGQTAPSPGITIRGAAIHIRTHDVLLQHVRIRPGDGSEGPEPDNRDGLKIGNYLKDLHNVVVDQVSVSWALDENVSLWSTEGRAVKNVTLRRCIISEALHSPLHPKGPHSMGLLIGRGAKQVSLIESYLAHNNGRNPLIRDTVDDVVVSNCLVYDPGPWSVSRMQVGSGPINASFLGNHLINGASSGNNENLLAVDSDTGPESVFVGDNLAPSRVAGEPWSVVTGSEAARALLPAITIPGYLPRPSSEVLEHVLAHAGARPADRDAVDSRVTKHPLNRTGRVIGTQADVGGWPDLAVNRRLLSVPSNHNQIMPSGYTRLEEWLHGFSAKVEGESVFSHIPIFGDRTSYSEHDVSHWQVSEIDGDLRYNLSVSDYSNLSGNRLGEWSVVPGRKYEDVEIRARVKSCEDFTSNGGADYALILGYQDERNYYYAMFNRNEALSAIFLVENGLRRELANAQQNTFTDNAFHEVAFTRHAGVLAMSIDGTEVAKVHDATLGEGLLGIGSFNDAAAFDDISVNGPPESIGATIILDEDTSASVILEATDPDGDNLAYTVVDGPSFGTLTGVPPILTYVPNEDYHGADAFTFKSSDANHDSNIATVNLTVRAVNDEPVLESVPTAHPNPVSVSGH